MKARYSALVLSCIALLGGLPAAKADVLYSQQSANNGLAYASQNDTGGGNGNFALVYDNFTLADDATITGVDWQGLFFNPYQQGNITGFTINFWADSSNNPGSLLSSTFVAGNAGEALVGGTVYNYTAAIANFAATAGTQYWLSVQPDLTYPPQWGWAFATPVDNVSYQDFFGNRSLRQADMTFSLQGQTASVPDAGVTFLYAGFAMAALVLVRRRPLR